MFDLNFLSAYLDLIAVLRHPAIVAKISCESDELKWDTIELLSPYIDWERLSQNPNLPDTFIQYFSHKVNWRLIVTHKKLDIEFIRNHLSAINKHWDAVSRFQNLDESAMREFADLISWDLVSRYQKMSPAFIKEFKNRVNWPYIKKYQNVTSDFIKEMEPADV